MSIIIIVQEHCDILGAKEDDSELRLEVMRGRKEWYAMARTTVRRWMLSGPGPVWKREIKIKKQGGAISISKLT